MTRLEELAGKFRVNPKNLNREELNEYVQLIRQERLEVRSTVRTNKRTGDVTKKEKKSKLKLPKGLSVKEMLLQLEAGE